MSKVIDIIREKESEGTPYFSFEFFPPKTQDGVRNLYERFYRMAQLKPSWIDVTWGAGGSTSALTMEICSFAQKEVPLTTMMHLTCTNLPEEKIFQALEEAKANGIRNILALRGDPPRGEAWQQIEGGFGHAVDLVRYIRQKYGDYFGICVAGYPEVHTDASSFEEDLEYLRQKVEAGADLVITQLFYDVDIFLKFVAACREKGINCPILPGLMPILSYAGFKRMTSLCKTHVPQHIWDSLEPIKDDDAAVKEYGIQLCIEMCQRLLAAKIPGLHFYTLNLERAVSQILKGLGLGGKSRLLPWNTERSEGVRPIFWSQRPMSYLHRTASWDEFPNGRWGDVTSPAFGDLSDYHLMTLHAKNILEKQYWGAPETLADVYNVFVKFLLGEIPCLPWIDESLAAETSKIRDQLVTINKSGFLTINSQPQVNGCPSSDPLHGWGPKNGFIYQKAYLEFFASTARVNQLTQLIEKSYPSITFLSVDIHGNIKKSHLPDAHDVPLTTAVTWGVFPGREILQPTVVDEGAFAVWKDEAFGLWARWTHQIEQGTKSRDFLQNFVDDCLLVSLVENNYVSGNIYAPFEELCKQD